MSHLALSTITIIALLVVFYQMSVWSAKNRKIKSLEYKLQVAEKDAAMWRHRASFWKKEARAAKGCKHAR